MMHKAWHSVEEVPYCFLRSSVKFPGHMGPKINDLNPILSKNTRLVVAIKSLRFALLKKKNQINLWPWPAVWSVTRKCLYSGMQNSSAKVSVTSAMGLLYKYNFQTLCTTWALAVKLLSGNAHYWDVSISSGNGLVPNQAITWANTDPDLCWHMASVGHNVLMI